MTQPIATNTEIPQGEKRADATHIYSTSIKKNLLECVKANPSTWHEGQLRKLLSNYNLGSTQLKLTEENNMYMVGEPRNIKFTVGHFHLRKFFEIL